MTKSKIKLNKRDFHRALLTDVHPYEIPFILTNEGFYKAAKSEPNGSIIENNRILKSIFEIDSGRESIPLVFNIAKDSDSDRKLYLVHPVTQLEVVKLYKDYNQLISHLCKKSSYSLRYPSKIAYAYYKKNVNSNPKPEEKLRDEGVGIVSSEEPVYASTFFEYKDVSFLYKFYDSYIFHRIEKKFNCLFKFDIAKCFASISTFQLARSLRDSKSYNDSRGLHSFEYTFEKLMNNCHYGHSHGIVVGPEFSRIFSEILLQSIDSKIYNRLLNYKDDFGNPRPLIENVDYSIKRYVDDYFLFYNNEDVKRIIYSVVISELDNYRLYCNESKNKASKNPFITGVTIAKQQFKDLLNDFFSNYSKLPDGKMGIERNLNFYYKISNQLITDSKCIVFNNNVPYSSITGYFFTLARIKVSEIDDSINDVVGTVVQCDKLTSFLLIIIEMAFFVFSMDFRVRSTYLISQIVILINRIADKIGDVNSERIKKKIYDEAYLSIKIALGKGALRNIESLNLLIAIRDIDLEYQLPIPDLEKIIGFDKANSVPCYFNLMTCLFYTQNKRLYLPVRNQVVNVIKDKFNSKSLTIENDSELIHLFFDSIRCPYITEKQKYEIAKLALSSYKSISESEFDKLLKIIKERNWFIDWDTSSSAAIERLLMKKELKEPYSS